MDRVIRIPNKVLIVAALILAIGGTAFTWGGDDVLFSVAKVLDERGYTEASHAAYRALVSSFSGSDHRPEALVRMAQQLPPHSDGYFDATSLPVWDIPPGQLHLWFWSPTFVGFTGRNVTVWDDDEAAARKIGYLEAALDSGLDATWEPRALAELGYTKAALGDYESAVSLFEAAWQSVDYRLENPWLVIWLARVYRYLNQLDQAAAVLEEALEVPTSLEKEIRYELADVLESMGAFREALAAAEAAEALERFRSFNDYFTRTNRLERTLKYLEGEHLAVAGRVKLNGEGLPGIRVLLSTGHHFEFGPDGRVVSSRWSSPPPGMITQAVTDADGYFEFFNLEPGQYGVSFMIPMQLAAESSVDINTNYADVREGETAWIEVDFDSRYVNITRAEIEEAEPYPLVHLAWEEVPGAASYLIRATVGGVVLQPWGNEGFVFMSTEAVIPLDEIFLYQKVYGAGGNTFSGSAGRRQLVLDAILGLRYPDVMLDFHVQAFDREGNPLGRGRVICPVTCGESDAQDRVTLEPPRPELNEGDRLLLERRYLDAIAAYERAVENDPHDYHSLLMLWHFAMGGFDEKRTHRDPERARYYGERLLELTEHEWHREIIERTLSELNP